MKFPRLRLRRKRRGLQSQPSNQNGENKGTQTPNTMPQRRDSMDSFAQSQMSYGVDVIQPIPPAPLPPDAIVTPPKADMLGGMLVQNHAPPLPDSSDAEDREFPHDEDSEITLGGYTDMMSIPIHSRGRHGSLKSTRSTLLDRASKFRRMLRERFSGTRTSGASSTTLDDIPDGTDDVFEHYSEADASIVKYATEMHNANANEVESSYSYPLSDSAAQSSVPSSLHRMPAEIQALQLCNDGYIEFLVPSGWIATRSMDSFCLSNGRSLGFVRAVQASNASEALLETDRLQVMSHVYALSSPTFENGCVTVKYSSNRGAGRG